jgi:L-threonylcarbamoyladenylate synthase
MNQTKTLHLHPDATGLARAAALLADGALIAFPTETVYGLGADARNGKAVAGIYAAKGRPSFNPLIVHLPDVAAARTLTQWTDTADRLAAVFWPGALTLVLPLAAGHGLSSLVTAGLNTVAIRVPHHPTAQALLRAANMPVAAPSANVSGRISPTTAQHVLDGLSGRIAAVLDDGPCPVGVESTIVSLTGTPTLLRPGGLPVEAIEAALGAPLQRHSSDAITAPGQLASHYAPGASVRLNATSATAGEVMLGFGDIAGDLTLSASGDLSEAAATLFDALHKLDRTGKPIAVAPIPHTGLGAAINDRLNRAAAPR